MDYLKHSDEELLLSFKGGSVRAFNTLFGRYWALLFNIAKKILEDDDRAKDTLQEVFVSFYEKGQQREIRNVRLYLLQSVKYQCFMQLRAGKISEKHLQRMQAVMSANYVEEYVDAKELQAVLDHTIASLPDRCREVFRLSRYELLPNKQIAAQLNISQKTVEHQITKALKTLKLSLDKLAIAAFFLHL